MFQKVLGTYNTVVLNAEKIVITFKNWEVLELKDNSNTGLCLFCYQNKNWIIAYEILRICWNCFNSSNLVPEDTENSCWSFKTLGSNTNVPKWTPSQILTRSYVVSLRWSDENWCNHRGLVVVFTDNMQMLQKTDAPINFVPEDMENSFRGFQTIGLNTNVPKLSPTSVLAGSHVVSLQWLDENWEFNMV